MDNNNNYRLSGDINLNLQSKLLNDSDNIIEDDNGESKSVNSYEFDSNNCSYMDIILRDQDNNYYASIFGIIYMSNDQQHSFFSNIWKYFIYIIPLFISFLLFISSIFDSEEWESNDITETIILFLYYASTFFGQMIILNIILYYVYKQVTYQRENMNKEIYMEAISYSFKKSYNLLFFLNVFLIIGFIFSICYYPFQEVIYSVFIFFPSNFTFAGVISILLAEQKISHLEIQNISNSIKLTTLNEDDYHISRKIIEKRENYSPINMIFIFGVYNVILCAFQILDNSSRIVDSIIISTSYLRVIIGVSMITYELLLSNELSDHIPVILCSKEWSNIELTTKRIGLFIASKTLPLRATLFYFKPTRGELFVRLLSVLFIPFASVAYKVIYNLYNDN
jgi:hypothetical protein